MNSKFDILKNLMWYLVYQMEFRQIMLSLGKNLVQAAAPSITIDGSYRTMNNILFIGGDSLAWILIVLPFKRLKYKIKQEPKNKKIIENL